MCRSISYLNGWRQRRTHARVFDHPTRLLTAPTGGALAAATARLRPMCGRYSNARTNPQAIAARFEIKISDATAERALGRTNIAATQSVLAVVNGENGERQAILARVGLAPGWAKLRGGPSLINTRDDKLASSGAW